ncbi:MULTISPECIES: oligosaccharide flippase family protein [Haloferax]|uniref:oligosaccharide flippase family protein n=1 Tax=Haloferax TaxID=2251 RepID=UPI0011C0688C|nr:MULTISPECIES: oligosaccharide flippase family protein [Haloferax]
MTDQSDSDYSQLLSGTSVVLVGTILGLGLGFLARSIPARLLGPDEFGLLVLGSSVATVGGFVSLLGFKDGISRYLPRAETKSQQKSVFLTAVTTVLPVSLLLAGFLFLNSNLIATGVFNSPDLDVVVRIFSVMIPLFTMRSIITSTFRGYKMANERVIVQNILNPLLRVVLVSGAVVVFSTVSGAAIGWVLASLISLLFGSFLLNRRTPIFTADSGPLQHVELIQFSAPLMMGGIMGIVLNQADNFLIGVFVDSQAVGLYDPAFMIGGLVTTGLSAFAFLFLPTFSKLDVKDNQQRMDEFYRVVSKWVISVTIPVYLTVAVFPKGILSLTFGQEFTAGSLVLVLIATGSLFNASVGLCVQALVSIGATRFILVVNILTAIANIGLNILLIPRFGIVGAAVASATTTIGYNTAYSIQLHRLTGITPIPTTALPAVGATVVFAAVVDVFVLSEGVPNWVAPLFVLAFSAIYLIFYILLGASGPEDVQIIDEVEQRVNINLNWLREMISP